ncbi:unnamed protein product [Pelagomonas calceolata]|uniref:Uncharacterized protein n=1 Tax=Pelagomonas calceolata TaxID=35677 RepID=A0A7S3ZS98_9STRA|nr:unnamed protein product [Pelagomonas calceolata]
MSFSMLYFSSACDAQSTASCCMSSLMSAFLMTALRSILLSRRVCETRACERAVRSHGCVGCAFVVLVPLGGGARARPLRPRGLRFYFVACPATAVRTRSATRLPLGPFVACSTAVRPFARGRAAREGRTVGRGERFVSICAPSTENVGRAVRGGARKERFYERWLPL